MELKPVAHKSENIKCHKWIAVGDIYLDFRLMDYDRYNFNDLYILHNSCDNDGVFCVYRQEEQCWRMGQSGSSKITVNSPFPSEESDDEEEERESPPPPVPPRSSSFMHHLASTVFATIEWSGNMT